MNILKSCYYLFLILFSVYLRSGDIIYFTHTSINHNDVQVLEELKKSSIIQSFDPLQEGRFIVFIHKDLLAFKEKRNQELDLLHKELRCIRRQSCLGHSLPFKQDEEKKQICLTYSRLVAATIEAREKEKHLSLIDFLAQYKDDKKRLEEDMKETNSRLIS